MSKENRFWDVLPFFLVYSAMALLGPLHFTGRVTDCPPDLLCFFARHTEEYLFFLNVNHFLRGFFALSVGLIAYAKWSHKTIFFLLLTAFLYSPLDNIIEPIQAGEFIGIYYALPPIFYTLDNHGYWLYIYGAEQYFMLSGIFLALLGYAITHATFRSKPNFIVPVYILIFVIVLSSTMVLFDQSLISTKGGVYTTIFSFAVIAGLRSWLWRRPINNS